MSIEIANRLIELRKRKGLSQEELADVLGVSRQAVSKWERAEASPDTDNLIALAKFYNVSLDELVDTSTPVEDIYRNKEEEKQTSNKNIKIDKQGIHVQDDDGSFVHISNDGISIHDNDNDDNDDDEVEETTDKDDKVVFNFKSRDQFKRHLHKSLVENILNGCMFLSVTIAYIILGTCTSGGFGLTGLNAWAAFWPMFILAPVPASLFKAIRKKKLSAFNYVFLVTGTYCFLGTLIGGWHPYWFLFLTIPVFYTIAKIIHRYFLMKKAKTYIDNNL